MPGYRAHLACAFVLYLVFVFCACSACAMGWQLVCGGLCAMLVGALFPDIDTKSKGQHYLYWVYAAVLSGLLIAYWRCPQQLWLELIVCLAIMTILPMLGRHRGITHAPLFLVILGLVAWITASGFYPAHTSIFFFWSCCFVLGALSHVWLDKRRIFFYR